MILKEIMEVKEEEVLKIKEKKHSLANILGEAKLSLIAEIKKSSPSRGSITDDFNPRERLQRYEQGGAGAVSILTDNKFFHGGKDILRKLRTETDLPLLRKDFIFSPVQVYESLFLGADIILLIAAVLDKKQLQGLLSLTEELGMEAIVEVHKKAELEMVMETDASIIGINNRNLKDFSVDLKKTAELIDIINNSSSDYSVISESGIKETSDIEYLADLGIDGVLIGETLMKVANPEVKIKELFARVWC